MSVLASGIYGLFLQLKLRSVDFGQSNWTKWHTWKLWLHLEYDATRDDSARSIESTCSQRVGKILFPLFLLDTKTSYWFAKTK